jgi:nitroreductase
MDAYQCVITKIESREFAHRPVPGDIKLKVLEAARLTGSGINKQHWRFVLVQDDNRLKTLASTSTTGKWVEGADFGVIVLTDPKYNFHMIDAGRVVQSMQIAAWNFGVTSCVYTGIRVPEFMKEFNTSAELNPTIVVGFGYPARKILGRKNRKPLSEVAFVDKYGNRVTSDKLTG